MLASLLPCVAAYLLVAPIGAPVPREILQREAEARRAQAEAVKLAEAYKTMTIEDVARCLRELADAGKLEVAARVLALAKERNAARLIEALDDHELGAQLLDRLLHLKGRFAKEG